MSSQRPPPPGHYTIILIGMAARVIGGGGEGGDRALLWNVRENGATSGRSGALEAPVSGRCRPSPAAGPPSRGAEHGGNRPDTGALRGRWGLQAEGEASDTKEERRVLAQSHAAGLRVFVGFFFLTGSPFSSPPPPCVSPLLRTHEPLFPSARARLPCSSPLPLRSIPAMGADNYQYYDQCRASFPI